MAKKSPRTKRRKLRERERIAMEIGTRDKRELEVEVRRRGAAAA